MDAKPIALKVLLQRRHLQTHRAFCREYDRVAAKADPALRGGWPSKAQFYRWLSGELVGLPYPDHRPSPLDEPSRPVRANILLLLEVSLLLH